MGLHFIKNGTKHDVCVKRPSLFPASATTYDNSQSGLSATRVQAAIDEVATFSTDTSVTGVTLYRFGKVVTLILNRPSAITTSGLTIPTGFRPRSELYFTGKAYVNGSDVWYQGFRITANGEFTARSTDNNTAVQVQYSAATITYVAED